MTKGLVTVTSAKRKLLYLLLRLALHRCRCEYLRWLDWIFLGGYLPSLSINYVAMSEDMRKRLPQTITVLYKDENFL